MTKSTLANGSYTQYYHDDNGNITRLQTTDSTAGDLLNIDYHYDGINNRTRMVDNRASVTYYYNDGLGHLITSAPLQTRCCVAVPLS